jgi:transitional endoplasmic reticulum ATPase
MDRKRMKAEDVTPLGFKLVRGEHPADPPGAPASFAEVDGLVELRAGVAEDLGARRHVLLYGPPGCGKRALARAAAGEAGRAFTSLHSQEVFADDPAASEPHLLAGFAAARDGLLFLAELDDLAFARRGKPGRLAEALLAALAGADPLVVAATRAPWDVDPRVRARFAPPRFVPPPDEARRRALLDRLLAEQPHDGIDTARLARDTPLFSAADLQALVQRALDELIRESFTGVDPRLTPEHLASARTGVRASTLEWLAGAREHAERYPDLATFLATAEAQRAW